MANLTSFEKVKLEKFFGMPTGYVLDFSNRTFSNFILENTGLEIYDTKSEYNGDSKANSLRAFWKEESNYIVGILILAFLEHLENKQGYFFF